MVVNLLIESYLFSKYLHQASKQNSSDEDNQKSRADHNASFIVLVLDLQT